MINLVGIYKYSLERSISDITFKKSRMKEGDLLINRWIVYVITIYGSMIVANALYSTTPDSKFKAMDPTSLFALPVIQLSPLGDKLAISYLNLTGLSLVYKTVTL